jgi:hypothetical protein
VSTFGEYKLFSARTQRLSERRQAASQTYLAVNTGLFGVMAFLAKDGGLRGWTFVLVSVPLFVMGIAACLIWLKIIADFREVSGWHYNQLREMEKAMPNCRRIYNKEWEELYLSKQGRERIGFARLESWLPWLFVALYAVYGAGLVLSVILGWL